MKKQIRNLVGTELEAAVEMALGCEVVRLQYRNNDPVYRVLINPDGARSWANSKPPRRFCSEPNDAWPIIDKYIDNLFKVNRINKDDPVMWCAVRHMPTTGYTRLLSTHAESAFVAAMRTFAVSIHGEEVNLPELEAAPC